jgi:pimeloyl-ACP methyl ester carboxylesterase
MNLKAAAHQQHVIDCRSPSGAHRMVVHEWGEPDNDQVLVCVHGLTRVGQDFQALAQRFSATHRVLAPDVVGRGASDWLVDPQHYVVAQYAQDMQEMAAQLNLPPVHWVGTSMGGLVAMMLAGHPERSQLFPAMELRSLVLNDVGAVVSGAALGRIGRYLGADPYFQSVDEAESLVRKIFSGFGEHSDAQWRHLTQVVLHPDGEGFRFHYDPALSEPFRAAFSMVEGENPPDMDLWSLYDNLALPTLLMRGGDSDILTEDVALAMTQRGPRARLLTVPGVGHAPSLVRAGEIESILEWVTDRGVGA